MSRLRLRMKDQRDELQAKARRVEADLKSDLERREKEVEALRTELYDTREAASKREDGMVKARERTSQQLRELGAKLDQATA